MWVHRTARMNEQMNLPPERRGCHSLLTEFVVGLTILGCIVLVGSIWHIRLPPEWGHGWRWLLLFLAMLGGLIFGGLIVGLVIVNWPKTEDEWGEWILQSIGCLVVLAIVGSVGYVVWHFIHKYW